MGKIQVGIIGVGKIAEGYDNPESDKILTHIKAYKFNPAFNVASIYDTDTGKVKLASKKWGIKGAYTYNQFEKINYDVISICTPEKVRWEVFEKCIPLQPKVIFCEKPLALNHKESQKIFEICSLNNIKLILNLNRLWLKQFQAIRQDILNDKFGEILSINYKYSGGLRQNGTHGISIIDFLLDIDELINKKTIKKEIDKIKMDFVISGIYELINKKSKRFILNLNGFDSSFFSLFEMDFIFEKERVRIIENLNCNIIKYKLQENKDYKGYWQFNKYSKISYTHNEMMPLAIKNIEKFIKTGEFSIQSDKIGLKTVEVCEKILNKL